MRRGQRWDKTQPPPPYVEHGKYTTYNNYGCRCDPCVEDNRRYKRNHRAANVERYRARDAVYKARRDRRGEAAYQRKRKYNLDDERFQSMLAEQGGLCAVCRGEFGAKGPHVDHDHACCDSDRSCGGCIRGLLCWACNGALGKLKDDPNIIEAARRYVIERSAIKEKPCT